MGSDLQATFAMLETKQESSIVHNPLPSMPDCQREYFKPVDLHRISREAPEGCTLILHDTTNTQKTKKAIITGSLQAVKMDRLPMECLGFLPLKRIQKNKAD
ncbi:hypothetical protein GZ78_02620 [Endozoicomonas numazuensis]|uniref:Uncharacterized protein n=1 Tax=Endozoicomonas numazuensis TaxID=1137799 RepID=A0A081NKI8_9GAMM|nr:hypothetical protein GZ78_02620 [Endozoicomonas numazuensis]